MRNACCCFRTQLKSSSVRGPLFGSEFSLLQQDSVCARYDLLFFAFSEWSDAKKSRARKAPQLHKTATPKRLQVGTPTTSTSTRHPLWLLPRSRLSALHPPPGAYGSTFPRLHQSSIFHLITSVPTGSRTSPSPLLPTTASASSMSSQASPQAPLWQQRHLSWWWPKECMTR